MVAILPGSIFNLINLEVLRIDHCLVHSLPTALGLLEKLKLIVASGCRLLGEIPMEPGSLSSLKVLLLRHTNITSIPETIRSLSCLETLDLAWCVQPRTLPELQSSLSSISVSSDSFLSVAPREILELPKLEKLHISRSNASILLAEISAFPMLEQLSIGNISFQCLPRLPSGPHKLSISHCHSLARLSDLSNLQTLSELRLHNCPKLVDINGLKDLQPLRTLSISFCARIAKLDAPLKCWNLWSI